MELSHPEVEQLTESHRCECDDISHGTMLEKMNTLQGIHISSLMFGIFEDDFPFPQVGYFQQLYPGTGIPQIL